MEAAGVRKRWTGGGRGGVQAQQRPPSHFPVQSTNSPCHANALAAAAAVPQGGGGV